MKKLNFLLLLFCTVSCISVDVTPTFYGDYKFSYTITVTKNGVENKSSILAGTVNVSAGTASKTIKINNYIDKDGNFIDFRVKLGKFYYNEKYDKQGCNLNNTYNGTIERNLITLKQQLEVKCGNDFQTAIVEGKGIR
jgi:hypothetical protein